MIYIFLITFKIKIDGPSRTWRAWSFNTINDTAHPVHIYDKIGSGCAYLDRRDDSRQVCDPVYNTNTQVKTCDALI
jgi:hypothetical protein